MLKRCEDTNLSLNWEKSHFMVKEGIVLGHKISKSGLEVDRAKVEVIAKLPHPTSVKGVRSFLGHAGFYRRFIQDFSKIARPMTHLLEKETPFVFSEECIDSFNTLKRKLTEAPILIAPDWDLPFELMCDASDFAIGAVLGQRKNKHFQPIHYASKTMNEAQTHYTTTEKELLAVKLENPRTNKSEQTEINEAFPLETLGSIALKDDRMSSIISGMIPSCLKTSADSQKNLRFQDSIGPSIYKMPMNFVTLVTFVNEFPDCEDSHTCSIPQRVSHPQLQFGNPLSVKSGDDDLSVRTSVDYLFSSRGRLRFLVFVNAYFIALREDTGNNLRTDNQEKNEKQSQNDKTGLGMEKTVKDKAKSKPENQSSQSSRKPAFICIAVDMSRKHDYVERIPSGNSLHAALPLNMVDPLLRYFTCTQCTPRGHVIVFILPYMCIALAEY
ncbi:reverse transcriptase domain-containing protein [Tanacetum coccineum]